ncbi:MAG: hypothetical protein ACN6O6_22020 [Pseudomonas sp.]|uniref:hypothetical protein n=1 Tax=Pseudomonas sp. TaxID=306 RepID=UPI003D0C96C8
MFRPYALLLLGALACSPLHAQTLPTLLPQADGYAVLIISRERLEVATPCEVGLYLQDQLAARIYQGQAVSFNLPPGPVSVRLGVIGSGICEPGIVQLKGQSLQLEAGEVRRLRIALNTSGLYLIPAPALQ